MLAESWAIFSVWSAFSAFCRMFEVISSIEEEISSTDAACSVAPCDICCAVSESCWLPAVTWFAAVMTSSITPLRFSRIVLSAPASVPISSVRASSRASTSLLRSPEEISVATPTAPTIGRDRFRATKKTNASATASDSAPATTSLRRNDQRAA